MRETHAAKRARQAFLTIEQAKANHFKIDWKQEDLIAPNEIGVKAYDDHLLEDLIPFIDWTPFFQTWELAGRYPLILEDNVVGEEATKLFKDAQDMLNKIVSEKWLSAKAVAGVWPADATGDDITVYTDESRSEQLTKFHSLRQQAKKAGGIPNIGLSDFIAPKETGLKDHIGAFVVTAGIGIDEHVKRFEADHDDYSSIMLKALADRLAEAFAEQLHHLVRTKQWGYAAAEGLSNDELIKEKYQGIRPAPGYPACPDHTEKPEIFRILNANELAGVTLTESLAMMPASSVSGLYFAHPKAKYFGLGKIGKDQVEDYASRKGMEKSIAERWLGPNLNYD